MERKIAVAGCEKILETIREILISVLVSTLISVLGGIFLVALFLLVFSLIRGADLGHTFSIARPSWYAVPLIIGAVLGLIAGLNSVNVHRPRAKVNFGILAGIVTGVGSAFLFLLLHID